MTLQALSAVSRFLSLLLLIGTFLLAAHPIFSVSLVSSGDQFFRGFGSTLCTRYFASSISPLLNVFG
jgi:hypothetical protein